MKVKDLKELLECMPEDREVVLSAWTGHEIQLFYLSLAVNTEHQEKQNQIWFVKGQLHSSPESSPAEVG